MGSFVLENRACITRINFDDIYFLEQRERKILFRHIHGETYVYAKIGEIDCRLYDGFFRCNKSIIINLANVIEISRAHIIFERGVILLLSEACCRNIRSRYREYAIARHAYVSRNIKTVPIQKPCN